MRINKFGNDDDKYQGHDTDFQLRELLVNFFRDSVQAFAQGNAVAGYNALKGIYIMIRMYPLNDKEELEGITHAIDEYLRKNHGDIKTMSQLIEINQDKQTIQQLLDMYNILVPKACQEIGIWLDVKKKTTDSDKLHSLFSFNSLDTTYKDKKKYLSEFLNLKQDQMKLFKICNRNEVNRMFARLRVKEVYNPKDLVVDNVDEVEDNSVYNEDDIESGD